MQFHPRRIYEVKQVLSKRADVALPLFVASSTPLALYEIFSCYIDTLPSRSSMSIAGASGKDTSAFANVISRFNIANESSDSRTSSTRNTVRDVSENEELIEEENVESPAENDIGQVREDDDDEFSALQNLSKADFKKVINFSLKSAAEAAAAATQSVASSASQKAPFNRLAIFNRADYGRLDRTRKFAASDIPFNTVTSNEYIVY